MGQLNKAGNFLCERLKEFHDMSTDDKLKSLEKMAEHVRTNKRDKTIFRVLKEYRGSKSPLTKAIDNKKSWISLVDGWQINCVVKRAVIY